MARQDRDKRRKPVYDWVQPKTINFVMALMSGICGGWTQGSGQGIEIYTDIPDSTMFAINYMLFGED